MTCNLLVLRQRVLLVGETVREGGTGSLSSVRVPMTRSIVRLPFLWLAVAALCGCPGDPQPQPISCSGAFDGTPCESGKVCSDGACVPVSTTRTVSGTFRTVHRAEAGTTTVDALPPGGELLAAVLVEDASPDGYATFAASADASGAFSVAGVPVGRYYLQLVRGSEVRLVPLVRSSPDLSIVIPARPDLARVSVSTPVTADVTNLTPWAPSNDILMFSQQADVWAFVSQSVGAAPAADATSYSWSFDWNQVVGATRKQGLPDPAASDVVFVVERVASAVQSGGASATVRRATRYARLDAVHVQDGVTAAFGVPLVDAPQTASVPANFEGTAFAALAPSVNPSATSSGMGMSVRAVPQASAYPDLPSGAEMPVLGLSSASGADVDWGVQAYGTFLDATWTEYRQITYSFRTPLSTQTPLASGSITLSESMGALTGGPAVPRLGPPTSPWIEGRDAFASQSGVGLQPVLSWSPPALGTPTSYEVTVIAHAGVMPGDVRTVRATVYGTSFRVPPGLLAAGRSYFFRVTARSAPWDRPDAAPFRRGLPLYTADCVSATFTP